jgi:hypothetical protein
VVELPWAADCCPCVEKLRTVLPFTVGIRDGAVQMVSTLRSRVGGVAAQTWPASNAYVFSTHHDNQKEICILILLGTAHLASDNKLMGQFTITNIPDAPRQTPSIEVSLPTLLATSSARPAKSPCRPTVGSPLHHLTQALSLFSRR